MAANEYVPDPELLKEAERYAASYMQERANPQNPKTIRDTIAVGQEEARHWIRIYKETYAVGGTWGWGPWAHSTIEYRLLTLALKSAGILNESDQKYLDKMLIVDVLRDLPCAVCQNHYLEKLKRAINAKKWPRSAVQALQFTVDVRNEINFQMNQFHPKSPQKPTNYTMNDLLDRINVTYISDAIRSAKVKLGAKQNIEIKRDIDTLARDGTESSNTSGGLQMPLADENGYSQNAAGATASQTPEGHASLSRFVLVIIAVVLVATIATVAAAGLRHVLRNPTRPESLNGNFDYSPAASTGPGPNDIRRPRPNTQRVKV